MTDQNRIEIDEDRCVASGTCKFLAPEVFDLDPESGIAIVLNANPPRELWAAATRAENECPALAISITPPFPTD